MGTTDSARGAAFRAAAGRAARIRGPPGRLTGLWRNAFTMVVLSATFS